MFEIVSGRPNGEVYHREVYVADTREKAEEALAYMQEQVEEGDNWLWGPHLYERPDDYISETWNGFEMEPSPEWS